MWKTPSSSRQSPPCNKRGFAGAAAFTLVELLVSMTILVLIVLLLAQVISSTTASISGSSIGMNSDQAASVALDRMGNTFRNMVASGGGTLVVFKNTAASGTASDGFALIANQRVRNRSAAGINVNDSSNIRLGAFGWCVASTATGGANPAPMLNWGDGTVTIKPSSGTYVQSQSLPALSAAAADVYAQISGGTASSMLQFTPVNPGIIRCELCFLLSDGTLASGTGLTLTPLGGFNPAPAPVPLPRNKNFVTGEAFAAPMTSFDASQHPQYPQYPLAFSAADSDAAPNAGSHGLNIYVRAVIVGLASLDPAIQQRLSAAQLTALAGSQVLKKAQDGKTPLDVWDITGAASTANRADLSPPNFPISVLQNIRFYQRYFYVN